MKILLIMVVLITFSSSILACDLSQPDKIRHIETAKKTTLIAKKVFSVPLLPLKPVKWIFNDKIQLIFPDNYIPQIISGTLVFTCGLLKEVPYDLLTQGDMSFCDIIANCHGIKEGIKNTP